MSSQRTLNRIGFETIIFGGGHGADLDLRKSCLEHLRKLGYVSTWMVEEHHFPSGVRRPAGYEDAVTRKSYFFTEWAKNRIWVTRVGGRELGAQDELAYLRSLYRGAQPRFAPIQFIRGTSQVIFREVRMVSSQNRIITSGSPVGLGDPPNDLELKSYTYRGWDELRILLAKSMENTYRAMHHNRRDVLQMKLLPDPKCEVCGREGKDEIDVNPATHCCTNPDCQIWWFCSGCSGGEGMTDCPGCASDSTQR
ncbi:MAG: hypothetical protein KAW39_01245 [Thermoplasmata archaeon]|nr:hypothetical protein [Thermoplasmata archaeon]